MSDSLAISTLDHVSTLLCGDTVALSTSRGGISADSLLGVFFRDERLISSLEVTVDGVSPPLLSSTRTAAGSDRIALLAALDKYRDGKALLVRRRTVGVGVVREAIELLSFGPGRTFEIVIDVQSDAMSILDLKSAEHPNPPLPWSINKSGRSATAFIDGRPFVTVDVEDGHLGFTTGSMEESEPPNERSRLQLRWKAEVALGETWRSSWSLCAHTDDAGHGKTTEVGQPLRAVLPRLVIDSPDYRWSRAVDAAIDDLEALVIDHKGERFIAAGAPWYLALFGRDSLLAAWETLPLGTSLALDVLETLAAHQGTAVHARRMEAPGKILHERRVGGPQVFGLVQGASYYGSVDSSPLFVILLTEVYRWGGDLVRIRELLPAARRAMQWCLDYGTIGPDSTDGPDGVDNTEGVHGVLPSPFLWYQTDHRGLGNQSWKDSGDCMVHADGSLATGPFAVAEVQGYFHDALVGLARLERDLGDRVRAVELEQTAASLAVAFDAHFWLADRNLIALALDGSWHPLRVATSNHGHCLWSGILSPERAAQVAARVMEGDLRSMWGIRTLGDQERAYNPLGYHRGTVWAHDSAIVAAGLARHGFAAEAAALFSGLLDAAEQFGWRLPELFCGLDTADGEPLPYPAACSPQAWSAGVPLLGLRAWLGLNPDVPAGRIEVRPIHQANSFSVSGIAVGGDSIVISVSNGAVVVTGTDLSID